MSKSEYQDIINLPHHQSANRPHMSLHDRAAQFAPFAALRGYDDEINETARLTDRQIELNDEQIAFINQQLNMISESIKSTPKARITYFVPDEKKEGGKYITIEADVRRIDEVQKQIILVTGESIEISKLSSIEKL
ncbi:MAG: hypothetical protein IJJ41_03835 [Clostridia bacterium]|nr:hypothetical protein [Clostridia bacterium]